MILTIERQVCSLKSSKRLKELGFSQESLFYYFHKKHLIDDSDILFEGSYWGIDRNKYDSYKQISAYTVAELGELLPHYVTGKFLTVRKESNRWSVGYMMDEGWIAHKNHIILAECLALMLIYLAEQKLIEVKK